MKEILRYGIVGLFCLFVSGAVKGQENFVYKVDFGFYFDNLEASDPWEGSRTRFAVKLAPEAGIRLGEKHTFMVGADMVQDLGDSTFLTKADYTVYYRFKNDNFGVYAGAFPRSNSIAKYPLSFFREEFNFFNSNIDGLMLQYQNRGRTGYVELFIDWYGQNQKLRIDEFMICGSSEYTFLDKLFLAGINASMNHYKNDYKLKDSYLFERNYYNVYVGTDLAKILPFLSEARVTFGTMSSMERKRFLEQESSWINHLGWQLDVALRWKGFGLRNAYYFGDSQMMYYRQYGGDLYWGSPFYQSDRYNRTDISWQWKKKFLSVKADFVFHYTPAGGVSTQQLFVLGFNLHQMVKNKKAVNID